MDLPLTVVQVSRFVAYLQANGLAPATIITYTSAIGYVHKLCSISDPTSHFLVQKTLVGIRRDNPRCDQRLPITLPILRQLVGALKNTNSNIYEQVLLRAMFLTAFFGFFRVGEITSNSHGTCLMAIHQLSFSFKKATITLRKFKHNNNGRRFDVVLKNNDETALCPVKALKNYLKLRGQSRGPLFCFPNLDPIGRQYFCKQLKQCLTFAGLDSKCYKSHSFRVGATCHASSLGMSDSQIRSLGRWSSNAFKVYVRSQCALPSHI